MSMPKFSERCELLSDQWIDAANVALQEIVAGKDMAGLKTFVVREEFADAPPHLGFAGNRATCAITVSDSPSVRRDADASADLFHAGDYQHWMPVKQAVGAEQRARAGALVVHLFGPSALRSEGAEPGGVVREILDALHDQMARRTIENPDVNHRARALGVFDAIGTINENGFVIVKNAIPLEQARELRDYVVRSAREDQGSSVQGLLKRGQGFVDVVLNPLARTIMDAVIGSGSVLSHVEAAVRQKGPSPIPIHTDYSYIPEPFPELPLSAQTIWALDDWTMSSGPVWMVPGSHKTRRAPVRGIDKEEGGTPLIMPAGSVCVFFSHTWHWAAPRTDADVRTSIHTYQNRPFIRCYDNHYAFPESILEQHSPLLSTFLCRDDPYEKSGPRGLDWERAVQTAAVVNWHQKIGRSGDDRYLVALEQFGEK